MDTARAEIHHPKHRQYIDANQSHNSEPCHVTAFLDPLMRGPWTPEPVTTPRQALTAEILTPCSHSMRPNCCWTWAAAGPCAWVGASACPCWPVAARANPPKQENRCSNRCPAAADSCAWLTVSARACQCVCTRAPAHRAEGRGGSNRRRRGARCDRCTCARCRLRRAAEKNKDGAQGEALKGARMAFTVHARRGGASRQRRSTGERGDGTRREEANHPLQSRTMHGLACCGARLLMLDGCS